MRVRFLPVLLVLATLNGQDQTVLRMNVDLVTVACSVTDRGGAPAQDLKLEDFVLRDNGQPQILKYLWQESELPLTVGLIVDVSGSQMSFVNEHRKTVAKFLTQVIGPQDQAFLVSVGRDVKLVTPLTGSIEELRNGVEDLDGRQRHGKQLGDPCRGSRSPAKGRARARSRGFGCGGTALWNGVYASSRLVMRPVSGRKALIVLSDGMDTGSTHSLINAIEAAQSADTVVYSMRYGPPGLLIAMLGGIKGGHALERLSAETGGREFSNPKEKISEVFAQIESELRSLYVLGFSPEESAQDGKFHKLEVKTSRKDLVVRTRAGYYAHAGHP